MYTIKLSALNENYSHSPYNEIFFATKEEAKNWFENRKNNVIKFLQRGEIDIHEVTRTPWIVNLHPLSDADNKFTPPNCKEETLGGYYLQSVIEAYLQSDLKIIPSADVQINGEFIENKFAVDLKGSSRKKLFDFLNSTVREMILKGESIYSVTVNGENANRFHFYQLFAYHGQTAEQQKAMTPEGCLPYKDAVDAVFSYAHLPHCEAVNKAIEFAAKIVIKARLRSLENLAKALKGI